MAQRQNHGTVGLIPRIPRIPDFPDFPIPPDFPDPGDGGGGGTPDPEPPAGTHNRGQGGVTRSGPTSSTATRADSTTRVGG